MTRSLRTPTATASKKRRPPVRAFLLDDHAIVRHGMRVLLESENDVVVVGESGNASTAVAAIHAAEADVVVIDEQLDGGSGIDVCRRLQKGDKPVRALILSESGGDSLYAALSAGASGFVLKSIDPRALLNAVRVVASGHSLVDSKLTEQLLARAKAPTTLPTLTPREKHVLALIALGLTNAQIATRLHLSAHTVKNHVTQVLSKLGVERRTHAALLATFGTEIVPD